MVLLVLLAGYFILKNRRAAPLPMKASTIQQTSCGRRNRPAKALRRRLRPAPSPEYQPHTTRILMPSCNLVRSLPPPGRRGLGVGSAPLYPLNLDGQTGVRTPGGSAQRASRALVLHCDHNPLST